METNEVLFVCCLFVVCLKRRGRELFYKTTVREKLYFHQTFNLESMSLFNEL